MITATGLTKRYARNTAVDQISFPGAQRQHRRLPGTQRRRARPLPCACSPAFCRPPRERPRSPDSTSSSSRSKSSGASDTCRKRRHCIRRCESSSTSTFVGRLKGLSGATLARASRIRARPLQHPGHAPENHRQALQGLPAARRTGAGHHSQSRRADPGRADGRPGPQADQRDAVADPQPGRRPHHHPQHAHPARGRADLPGGDDHQSRASWWPPTRSKTCSTARAAANRCCWRSAAPTARSMPRPSNGNWRG